MSGERRDWAVWPEQQRELWAKCAAIYTAERLGLMASHPDREVLTDEYDDGTPPDVLVVPWRMVSPPNEVAEWLAQRLAEHMRDMGVELSEYERTAFVFRWKNHPDYLRAVERIEQKFGSVLKRADAKLDGLGDPPGFGLRLYTAGLLPRSLAQLVDGW